MTEPEEQEFPDCAECAPCRCDDECDCNGGVCSMCGHWTDMTTKKVYIVFDRQDYDKDSKAREEENQKLADDLGSVKLSPNEMPKAEVYEFVIDAQNFILDKVIAALTASKQDSEGTDDAK